MTDAKDVTFEFNVFDDGRTHLKILGPGTPSVEFLLAAKGRLLDAVGAWDEAQESPETPPVERQGPAPQPPAQPPGNRPPGGATEAQCRKILAVCHRLSDDVVTKAIEGYAGAEWDLIDGQCIPKWNFLQSLDKFKASKIIEKLERAQA